MAVSQNGWPASKDPSAIGVKPFVIAGRDFPGGVKGGDVATVLSYVAYHYHWRVESLYYGDTDKDDWGYYFRVIAGSGVISNHGSATAFDVNATTNPQGVAHSHTYAQEKTIRSIMAECDGLVTWGVDFDKPDPMHFEIAKGATPAQIKALAKKLKHPAWWTRNITVGTYGQDVRWVQKRLGRPVTGKFIGEDRRAVALLQQKCHLTVSGVVNAPMAFFIGVPA